LQKGAKDDYGGWDLTYLETCMQAKGFVMDNNLTMDGGHLCEFHSAPWTEAACYRPDDPVAKIVAKEIYR